jgi:hypothetical protein
MGMGIGRLRRPGIVGCAGILGALLRLKGILLAGDVPSPLASNSILLVSRTKQAREFFVHEGGHLFCPWRRGLHFFLAD